jgi:excinuclease ABC subunit C
MEKFTYLPKAKLSNLPKAPGVYALSSSRTILYIGKAGNIRDRVKNHFAKTSYKDNLFIQNVTRVGYIKTDSDIDALILESQLIKIKQPKYNVMWKDDKKYFYVAITKEQLPRVFLTHQPVRKSPSVTPGRAPLRRAHPKGSHMATNVARPPKTTQVVLGPFTEGKAIKRVLRFLRRVFAYYTAKKHGTLSCQYCHLGLCPGPTPYKKAYKKNIRNLVSVLKGKKTKVQKQLEKEMKIAAKNQDFEKAAALRDQFLSFKRIVSHARIFSSEIADSPNWNLIENELQKLFSTKKRISRIEAFDISNIQGKEATGSQVTFLKGVPLKDSYRKYKIRIAGKPDDFAMIKELVSRRLKHPEWPYPQLMVIDGGKGQLSSAAKALFESRRKGIFLSALAKQRSELFFEKKSKPTLLRDLPRPVENLFLHIRDEAHRFAITYHRTLRSRALLD